MVDQIPTVCIRSNGELIEPGVEPVVTDEYAASDARHVGTVAGCNTHLRVALGDFGLGGRLGNGRITGDGVMRSATIFVFMHPSAAWRRTSI